MAIDLGGVMKKLNPTILLQVMEKYDGRKKVWGELFPETVTGESKIECDELAHRLQEKGIPNALVDVLALVRELGTENGWNVVRRRSRYEEVELPEFDAKHSYQDCVATMLLRGGEKENAFLERAASLKQADKRVAYAYFPHRTGFDKKTKRITPEAIEDARLGVVERLVREKIIMEDQEQAVRIFVFDRDREILFLIRYPGRLNREVGCDASGIWHSYVYNPAQYDTVIYDRTYNALKMNTPKNPARAQERYRIVLGHVLFRESNVFRTVPDVVTMGDIGTRPAEDIFSVRGVDGLTSLHLEGLTYIDNSRPQVETQLKVRAGVNLLNSDKARSVLAVGAAAKAGIDIRKFVVRYRIPSFAESRLLTVEVGDKVNYPRDGETLAIERWMRLRHFIKEEADGNGELGLVEPAGDDDGQN